MPATIWIKAESTFETQHKNIIKVICNLYSGSESYYTCIWVKLHYVNPAALPLVHCYSILLPRRAAIAELTTAGNELNFPVSTASMISAC